MSEPTKAWTHQGATIKPAEPTDNPGELMAAGMPLAIHGREPGSEWKGTNCPTCDARCYVSPKHLKAAAMIYPDRMVAVCTKCAVTGHQDNGFLQTRLKSRGFTPATALVFVLSQAERRPMYCPYCPNKHQETSVDRLGRHIWDHHHERWPEGWGAI